MLDCATLVNAKMYIAAIKDQIDNNEVLKLIAKNDKGVYVLEPDKNAAGGWTEDRILLKHRTKLGMKEPSLFVSAVDNNRTGMHPDVIIMDDLVSENTVTTKEQRNKTKTHYRFSLSLLERNGLQVVIGTRYHMDDLYDELLKNKGFNCIVRPAILPNGKCYFPTKYPIEVLAELKRDQGADIYNSQYMLDPTNEDDATFKVGNLNYYEDGEFEEDIKAGRIKFQQVYIITDLAITQNKRSDFTVVMIIGVTADKKIYVVDYSHDKFTPSQTVTEIFKQYEKARKYGYVHGVYIETVAFQKVMLYLLKDEAKRRGISIPLKELKANKDKTLRINGLVPLVDNGDVYISGRHTELRDEMREFPFGRHDDIIDTLAYILQVLRPRKIRLTSKEIIYIYSESIYNNKLLGGIIMKERSKYVLEGAIVELTKNEYDRYLSINDILTQIDSQKYLGSITEEEADQCADVFKRVMELKDNEITLLQTLSRNMFAFVRPEKQDAPIEGQIDVSELSKEKAMKGVDTKLENSMDAIVTPETKKKKEE